jgi:hypothetical protein
MSNAGLVASFIHLPCVAMMMERRFARIVWRSKPEGRLRYARTAEAICRSSVIMLMVAKIQTERLSFV